MKYATTAGLKTDGDTFWTRSAPQERLRAFHQTHKSSLSSLQSAVLSLDESRLYNLLEDCRFRYGHATRDRARAALHRWRNGLALMPDETTASLFVLLTRQMTPEEKLAMIRDLLRQWIADLPRASVSLTVVQSSDLLSLAQRVANSVQHVPKVLPADLVAILGWQTDTDAKALGALALGAEQSLMLQRLAAVLVHLGTLARLRTLSSPSITVRVRARLEVPTLTVSLNYQPCFWRQVDLPNDDITGQSLLLRLQELALLPASPADLPKAALARDSLTPRERERLTALAVGVGLQTDNLLSEIQAQTLAARADIEATAAIAERLKSGRLRGSIVSEHCAPGCGSRIEIRHALCPLARISLLTR
jgi:hypothetical protein